MMSVDWMIEKKKRRQTKKYESKQTKQTNKQTKEGKRDNSIKRTQRQSLIENNQTEPNRTETKRKRNA